ncbi:SRPBCC family protein [Aeromicrobium sp. CTD01-1L150]|uniref:SRPBCC family protein n=1 Tax=Aeromicrobium sp. CTD01-1L150 TaxID=3341830 RepID=UPI0035C14C2C
MTEVVVEQESVVAAPIEQVWERVVDPEGINDELRPWMTMSMPSGAEGLSIETIEVGEPIGRSWIRLFGILPVDYDDLTVAELEPGRSFREESTMLSARTWRHERTLAPTASGGTHVHDRLTFAPRVPGRASAALQQRIIAALFRHRHRRLAAHFSG